MADEKILARIRALLAQAEHPNTSAEEAEAFSDRAMALMQKYCIDQAVLQATTKKAEARDVIRKTIQVSAPYAKEKFLLLGTIAQFNNAQAIGPSRGFGQGATVELFGFESDVEAVDMLFTSLLLQASRDMLRQRTPFGEDKATFRSSWLLGFRIGIYRRLKALKERAQAEVDAESTSGPSTAIVLADRNALVKQVVDAAFDDIKVIKMKSSGSGHRAGYESGLRADLGQDRVQNGQQHALR